MDAAVGTVEYRLGTEPDAIASTCRPGACDGVRPLLLVGVPLLAPDVAGEVIAALLPEAAYGIPLIVNGTNPFGALPAIQVRQHQAKRPPILGSQRLAVEVGGKQRPWRGKVLEPDAAAVPTSRGDLDVLHAVGRGRWVDEGPGSHP